MTSYNLPAVAVEGFKDASAYDTYRPSYPTEAVDQFLSHLKLVGYTESNVVEIAAGTGKFTKLLAQRTERFNIKAIEPHEGMRQTLVEKDLQAVEVIDGTADNMPVSEEWGDACIAAQAFHWFSTPESLREIHRALRPGAVFGAIWNVEDYNKPREWEASTKWEQKLNDLVWSLEDGQPRFRHMKWRGVFDQDLPSNPFQVIKKTIADHLPTFSLPIGEGSVKWTNWLSEEALWSRFNTLSQVAVLKGKDRDNVVRLFKEALAMDDVERNRKGEIALHGLTYFVWTDRL
ncbi:methyltransferase [Pseudomassariella vexata]|uniref:Methyltransferase n=1 Tax=Pseudomassariella vexata TaxID=1141098 RepID=A0A1Y2E2R9_9PEZI|nr:methyltransferase [Pseudomassariella vexata]ORY65799.1 methyltransferase [Pseudomassariella vexata]